MPNCTWSFAARTFWTAGAPCTAGIAAATAVTAPAAFTKSRRETSWSWAMMGTSSSIFPDCNMQDLVTELLVARIVQSMTQPAAGSAPQDRRGLLPHPHADRAGQRLRESSDPL